MTSSVSASRARRDASSTPYDPASWEPHWQRRWERVGAHAVPEPRHDADDLYLFAAPPFTSGNLHIGHVRSYTVADVYARFRRMTGASVLFANGFDSFGLPAELGALRSDQPTAAWVETWGETQNNKKHPQQK
ncbi:MAG: class I tRNA ligase family protein [Conexibacter sp.]